MTEEFLLVKMGAELFKKIQGEDIDIVGGANQVLLELPNPSPNLILILGRILVDEEVVEKVAILCGLESRTVQFIVKLFDSHITTPFLSGLFDRGEGDRPQGTTPLQG